MKLAWWRFRNRVADFFRWLNYNSLRWEWAWRTCETCGRNQYSGAPCVTRDEP